MHRPRRGWEVGRVVARDAIFFMNGVRSDSPDGGYCGPLPESSVIGRATPLRTGAPFGSLSPCQHKGDWQCTQARSNLPQTAIRDASGCSGSTRRLSSFPPNRTTPRTHPTTGFISMRKPVRRSERSEEHTSELQSLMRISYAVFCLTKKHNKQLKTHT